MWVGCVRMTVTVCTFVVWSRRRKVIEVEEGEDNWEVEGERG